MCPFSRPVPILSESIPTIPHSVPSYPPRQRHAIHAWMTNPRLLNGHHAESTLSTIQPPVLQSEPSRIPPCPFPIPIPPERTSGPAPDWINLPHCVCKRRSEEVKNETKKKKKCTQHE